MKKLLLLYGTDDVEYNSKKIFSDLLAASAYKSEYDILMTSHYPCKNTLVDMTDYFLFDKNIADDNKTFFNSPFGWTDVGSFKLSYINQTHSYSKFLLLKKSLQFANSCGYTSFLFIDINNYSCVKKIFELVDESKLNTVNFFKRNGEFDLNLVYGNINMFLNILPTHSFSTITNKEQYLTDNINLNINIGRVNVNTTPDEIIHRTYQYDVSGIFYNKKEKYIHNIVLVNNSDKIKKYYVISTKSTDFVIDLPPNNFYIDWFDVSNHNFDYSIFIEENKVICKKISGVVSKENVLNISSNRIIEFK